MTRTTTAATFQGTITVHPRGFGFLNFRRGDSDSSAFVSPPDLNPFLAGDTVEAEVVQGDDGRFSARNLRLVSRGRSVLFGQASSRKGKLWLLTDKEVANTSWPLRGKASPDDYVLAQIDGDQAVVAEVLGPDEDIPLERLIARFDLVEEFDDECYQQVEQIVSRAHKLGKRRDLREITTITVDAPTTTDLDDAVSVLPADSDGAVRLLVSIADPCEFIKQGSALDEEARARGTSTYLADRVLPMLPHELSSGHLSLLPEVDRCCITVEMRIDIEGEIRSVDLYESVIRSATRVNYQELDRWLVAGEMTDSLDKVEEVLPWFRTAFARLSVARSRRGGVRMEGEEEVKPCLDEDGQVIDVEPVLTNRAHLLVERFMVAANISVARWLSERGFPGIYRIHPEPDSEKVEVLTSSARLFGFEVGFQGRITPIALAGLDQQVRGVRNEAALRSVMRGVLEKARYAPEAGLHLGLGTDTYLHFTSPLRRYSDFAVHRLLKAYLRGERGWRPDDPKWQELCDHLNRRTMLAGKAEAFRRRMLLARYMKDSVGEEFDGRITRVLPFGLVVQLEESWVEGLLPLESLPGGPWTAENTRASSPKRTLVLAQAVRVELVSVEPDLGQLEFKLC